jgi:hypothetical protein
MCNTTLNKKTLTDGGALKLITDSALEPGFSGQADNWGAFDLIAGRIFFSIFGIDVLVF